jgi:hypothetical protein
MGAPDMAFTVTYTNLPTEENGDDDTYEVLESGVLKLKIPGRMKTYYYVPDVWQTLVADSDHEPGTKKGPA